MSGHSHWSSIKHKKGAEDAKKGKIFSKFSRLISVVAREKGGNPETNSELKIAIDKAKSFNMSQDKIERAIKKGTGEIEGSVFKSLLLEGLGPQGVAIIIEALTDNKNRTISEIRHILDISGGKLASGGVLWMFKKKGIIEIKKSDFKEGDKQKEEIEMIAIDLGAEDIKDKEDILEIYVRPDDFVKIKNEFENAKIKVLNAVFSWEPKEEIVIEEKTKDKIKKLFNLLGDHEDVQEIYSNMKN